ncbi:hypothetical protein E1B28_000870 [Marasmius oreades]|uniref:MYND-type domain-containing protein n=1 Tax=Marasmius oreades TaxID=181124 RepID=A0A9P8AEU4_9AGAR|nr:uncharacterized protein E1B28_000870 [Marasmius oreades]KAG7098984.1 hypothetical protein E1B28_000870 [Marasmius oreades]
MLIGYSASSTVLDLWQPIWFPITVVLTVPYCSVTCQRQDWSSHKKQCLTFLADKVMNYKGTTFGEKAPKGKASKGRRTRLMRIVPSLFIESQKQMLHVEVRSSVI